MSIHVIRIYFLLFYIIFKSGISFSQQKITTLHAINPIWDQNLNIISISLFLRDEKNQLISTNTLESSLGKKSDFFVKKEFSSLNNLSARKSLQLDGMNINLSTGPVKVVATPISFPCTIQLQKLSIEHFNRLNEFSQPILPDILPFNRENNLSWKFPHSFKIDSSFVSRNLKSVNAPGSVDKLADQQAAHTDAGREILNMDAQSMQIRDTESLMKEVDYREIKESIKNSNAFKDGIDKANEGVMLPDEINSKIQSARQKMTKLKNKFSSLPSSDNLKNGEKRNSLKDVPFRKRIVLGGHAEIKALNPFSFDFAPESGYRINNKIRTGITLHYYAGTEKDKTLSKNIYVKSIGYGIFTDHNVYKGFFARVEFEHHYPGRKFIDSNSHNPWLNALRIGLGKEYYIKKGLHGTCMILYDTMRKTKVPPTSPWQFKFGIITSD